MSEQERLAAERAISTLLRYADQGEHLEYAYREIDEAAETLRRALLAQKREPEDDGLARIHPDYLKHLRKLEQVAIARGEVSPTDWEKVEAGCAGTSYGFTWDDVDRLRSMGGWIGPHDNREHWGCPECGNKREEGHAPDCDAAFVEDLADRIAAMLRAAVARTMLSPTPPTEES